MRVGMCQFVGVGMHVLVCHALEFHLLFLPLLTGSWRCVIHGWRVALDGAPASSADLASQQDLSQLP